jgi:hypothetical protein
MSERGRRTFLRMPNNAIRAKIQLYISEAQVAAKQTRHSSHPAAASAACSIREWRRLTVGDVVSCEGTRIIELKMWAIKGLVRAAAAAAGEECHIARRV